MVVVAVMSVVGCGSAGVPSIDVVVVDAVLIALASCAHNNKDRPMKDGDNGAVHEGDTNLVHCRPTNDNSSIGTTIIVQSCCCRCGSNTLFLCVYRGPFSRIACVTCPQASNSQSTFDVQKIHSVTTHPEGKLSDKLIKSSRRK